MKLYKLTSIYIFSYYFFGAVALLFTFGFENSLNILKNSPMDVEPNGTLILFSSFIASIFMISLMRKRLLLKPFPYFMLGFYIGNVSLLLMFLFTILLSYPVIWTFPEFLLIFLVPFIELFFSYLMGFAFIAFIPSWISAYILFKVIQHKEKKHLLSTSS